MNLKKLILAAIFAAITSVFSIISIPVGEVPITLSLFAVFLSAMILGGKFGAISQLIYIAIGVVGIPVFANFRSGIGVLAGPTGGFIISYVVMAGVMGLLIEKTKNKSRINMALIMLLGLLICYALGTAHFMIVMSTSFYKALTITVLPFVFFDILKIMGATVLAFEIRKRTNLFN